jgi:NAD-dependent deacetylase
MIETAQIDSIAAKLAAARRVVVFTGAGVSAESGIPTFRDAMTGLWARFNPADLASPEAFERDPVDVTKWYDERRGNVAACKANPGHLAIARLEKSFRAAGKKVAVITQNVDRLHQAAGSTDVIELHGSLWVWRCVDCAAEREERGPSFAEYPPRCECGGIRRPGVVWFGENLPYEAMDAAYEAVKRCDFFMTLGTSSEVYPAAGFIDEAIRKRIDVLEVNLEPTRVSDDVTWSVRGRTGQVLPEIVEKALR